MSVPGGTGPSPGRSETKQEDEHANTGGDSGSGGRAVYHLGMTVSEREFYRVCASVFLLLDFIASDSPLTSKEMDVLQELCGKVIDYHKQKGKDGAP